MALEAYTGEIRMFAGTTLPNDWQWCDGKTLAVAQYGALFSIIGNKFGGDGKQNFAVPDLRTKVPMGIGRKQGLSPRNIGDTSNISTYTVTINSLPTHTHTLYGTSSISNATSPENALHGSFPVSRTSKKQYSTNGAPTAFPDEASLNPTGATIPRAVSVLQPYLAVGFAICLTGEMPHSKKEK